MKPAIEYFSAEEIADLRNRARALSRVPRDSPEGWSKRAEEPAEILALFEGLRLKPGFVLRGYQYFSRNNGNGFVWALPADSPCPDPEDCPKLEDRFLKPPKPPGALADFRDVIEGDGSLRSYLHASIAARELLEFGAEWHGVAWGNYEIVGGDPLSDEFQMTRDLEAGRDEMWEWSGRPPEDWKPRVSLIGDSVEVQFFTYTEFVQRRIEMFTDRYAGGSYRFTTEKSEVAIGPGGFIP